MKQLLFAVLLVSCFAGFSQNEFPKMPENAEEIRFTYKQSSKIFIDESGIYADSLFLVKHFPKSKFTKVDHPKERFLNSFIQWNSFRRRDKE